MSGPVPCHNLQLALLPVLMCVAYSSVSSQYDEGPLRQPSTSLATPTVGQERVVLINKV